MTDANRVSGRTVRADFRSEILVLLRLAILAVALCIAARFFASRSWFCDIVTAFTLQQFLLAAFALVGLVLLRAWRSCIPALLCTLWLGMLIAPYLPWHTLPGQPPADMGHPVRVMLTNVLSTNANKEAVLRSIRAARPDLVCAQEIDVAWEAAFAELQAEYPHHHSVPRPDNFGMGFWSKFPILSSETRQLGDATVPSILLRLDVHGVSVNVLALHTMPPLLGDYADTRNLQLAAVPAIVREMGSPFLLVGDLNTTMWSPYFQRLEVETGLSNARRGFGLLPSWPVLVDFLPATCPIDHIFVSRDMKITNFQRGPRVGSDHHAVWADVVIPAPSGVRLP